MKNISYFSIQNSAFQLTLSDEKTNNLESETQFTKNIDTIKP